MLLHSHRSHLSNVLPLINLPGVKACLSAGREIAGGYPSAYGGGMANPNFLFS